MALDRADIARMFSRISPQVRDAAVVALARAPRKPVTGQRKCHAPAQLLGCPLAVRREDNNAVATGASGT